jgi:hyperosmotically inducible periplasmic protein
VQIPRAVLRVMHIAPAIVSAVAAAAFIAPAAAAADTPGTYPDKFERLDTNRDGFISRSEIKRYQDYGTAFDEADENHDGRLDRDEFIKAEAIYARIEAGEFVDDSVITAKVKAALLKEPNLKSLDVSVETYRGQVLLSGFVDSASQRVKALQVAASIEGVHGVKDGMAVK